YWGPNLARNLRDSPDWDLRTICDLDLERARKVAGEHGHVTDKLDDVLADDAIDAVVVATPAWTHAEVSLAALEAGKHLLVEKPLASSYADGEKIVRLAAERGLTVMCDHTYCYTPAVQKIAELVR